MTQAQAIAAVAMALAGLIAGLASFELWTMRKANKTATVPARDIMLLDEIEFEFEYATRDESDWDHQAYVMYLEEV